MSQTLEALYGLCKDKAQFHRTIVYCMDALEEVGMPTDKAYSQLQSTAEAYISSHKDAENVDKAIQNAYMESAAQLLNDKSPFRYLNNGDGTIVFRYTIGQPEFGNPGEPDYEESTLEVKEDVYAKGAIRYANADITWDFALSRGDEWLNHLVDTCFEAIHEAYGNSWRPAYLSFLEKAKEYMCDAHIQNRFKYANELVTECALLSAVDTLNVVLDGYTQAAKSEEQLLVNGEPYKKGVIKKSINPPEKHPLQERE